MVPVSAPVPAQRIPFSARSSTTCSRRSGHHRRQLVRSASAAPTRAPPAAMYVSSAIWMLFTAPASHTNPNPHARAPQSWWWSDRLPTCCADARIRLGDSKPARTGPRNVTKSNEVIRVREYSVPARFSVGEHDNIAAMVFEHERDDPSFVIFQRLIDGVWTDVTCAEAANEVRSAALGLISLGVQGGERVSIFSATRYEWAILDLAILSVGAVTVPIYETSSAEQVRWVLQDSEAVLAFAETDAHASMVTELTAELPALRRVLHIDGSGPKALDQLVEAGASVDPAELP